MLLFQVMQNEYNVSVYHLIFRYRNVQENPSKLNRPYPLLKLQMQPKDIYFCWAVKHKHFLEIWCNNIIRQISDGFYFLYIISLLNWALHYILPHHESIQNSFSRKINLINIHVPFPLNVPNVYHTHHIYIRMTILSALTIYLN